MTSHNLFKFHFKVCQYKAGHDSDSLILSQSLVEYLRDPFLDLSSFCYILMIYQTLRNCSVFTYLLMTLIYIFHEKTLMILN